MKERKGRFIKILICVALLAIVAVLGFVAKLIDLGDLSSMVTISTTSLLKLIMKRIIFFLLLSPTYYIIHCLLL